MPRKVSSKLKHARIRWTKTHRLVNTVLRSTDAFDDIADPHDWGMLTSATQKTSARTAETVGNLEQIPAQRRVSGKNSAYVMAPFTHISSDRAGRFHDGHFGAYYAARKFETALFETAYHRGKFCAATSEPPGWIANLVELVGKIDARLVDIRGDGYQKLLKPDDYSHSQAFARRIRHAGKNGIAYPSVRHQAGECFAAFYPDVMAIPVPKRRLGYHWNGSRINLVKDLDQHNRVYELLD